MDVMVRGVIRVTFNTRKRVLCSWQVWPMSPDTANNLSSMSALVQWCPRTRLFWPGGCHVILLKWRTGVEQHPVVTSAHVGWTTHVQSKTYPATVMLMIRNGVKTAGSSLTRLIFQLNSWGLEMPVILIKRTLMNKATIHWESSVAMELPDWTALYI